MILSVCFAAALSAACPTNEITGALGPYVERGEIAGVVSVLSDRDYNVTVDCLGWADAENKVPMATNTLFAVFSMTKTFTGCALMVAVDRGLLRMDDPVAKYLPEFGSVTNRITIRDCMCHVTGIDGGHTEMVHAPDSVREQARTFATKGQCVRKVGESFRYGNASVNTAAACLEVAAGMPYEEFLQQNVLDPLGMKDTTFFPNEEQLGRLVKAYTTKGGPFKPAEDYCSGQLAFPVAHKVCPMPAAGLFSTPADMIRFSQMLAHHGEWKGVRIVSRKTFDGIWAVKQTPDNVKEPYTVGSWLYGDWFGHEGAMRTDQRANLRTGHSRVFFIQTENAAGKAFFDAKKQWNDACDRVQAQKSAVAENMVRSVENDENKEKDYIKPNVGAAPVWNSVPLSDIRAVQLDLARQMETVPFVKAFVDKVSDAGYNTLVLYLEGRVATKTFALPANESYTEDQVREMVAYATKRGMDVVPCVSVLGHAEHFFREPGRDELSEERSGKCRWDASEKQTFCATSAKARAFLEAYLAEVAALFPGRNFHAGLDESWQFGFCPTCRARREQIGFGPLFSEHVKWARNVLAKLGKRMWMWDDMYEFFPEELANAPRDVVMCLWIYDDDVSEWGHRGHFLNRIRVDWLAEYEKLGIDAIPVGAACRDNLRTLGDYAARHKTLGFYVSQWEMTDSFYGVPMANLVGVDRAYPTLTAAQKRAVEALAAKWSYFSRGCGVGWSRARHGDKLVADRNADENERASIALAVEVLKGCASHPGVGPVPTEPLSEAALVDDLVTHFGHLLFWHELDAIAPHLVSPRRTAAESQAAKAKLRAMLPSMERIAARKAAQQVAWRPGVHAPRGGLVAPVKDHIAFAKRILDQPDVAPPDDWVLGLSLSLPDYHGIPKWTVEGRFGDGWRVLAQGTYKPGFGDWANFERKIPFKSSEAPTALRVSMDGYGEGMLLYAQAWNRDGRFVPDRLVKAEGLVQNPEFVLRDDYMPVRFGHVDRKAVFLHPERSAEGGSIEVSLRPVQGGNM